MLYDQNQLKICKKFWTKNLHREQSIIKRLKIRLVLYVYALRDIRGEINTI